MQQGGTNARAGLIRIPMEIVGFAATHFRSDSTGAFSGVVLPEGTYDITFKTRERDDVSVSGVVVAAGEPELAHQVGAVVFDSAHREVEPLHRCALQRQPNAEIARTGGDIKNLSRYRKYEEFLLRTVGSGRELEED